MSVFSGSRTVQKLSVSTTPEDLIPHRLPHSLLLHSCLLRQLTEGFMYYLNSIGNVKTQLDVLGVSGCICHGLLFPASSYEVRSSST